MNHDDPLDRAIDEVARELTRGAPRAGFTTRVLASLDTPRRARAWGWQLAAAAAALAVVVYLVWPAQNRQSAGVQMTRPPASAPRAPGRELTPGITPAPSTRAQVVARASTPPAPVRRPRPESRMRLAVDPDVAQLDAILEPENLTLAPIEIAELTITPLEPEKESR